MAATQLRQEIQTGQITVMSNLMSVTVEGKNVSRLESDASPSPCIHANFVVKRPSGVSAEVEPTEALELILSPADAVELGRSLLAMGLAKKTSAEVQDAIAQLQQTLETLA